MSVAKKINENQLYDPNQGNFPSDVEISQPCGIAANWQTPGLYMAQKISSHREIRFVGEKYEVDYLQTILVLDHDPEDLLDQIFSIEQEMYSKFKGLRFDVRVRVIPPQTELSVIKQSTVLHYERK